MKFRNDSYYINKVKQGDPSAYAFLVDKHKRMAYNVALQLMGNREDAQEVSQDAFLKAYQALDGYKGESKFSTWIYRIIYNTAISRLRKKKLPITSMDDEHVKVDIVGDTQSALKSLKGEERKRYLNEAMNKLENDERVILTLFYLDEKTVDEVSEITGWSPSNVKVKLHRARKRLYSRLQILLKEELKMIL